MSPETLRWILAVHVYAMLMWAGSLIALTVILKQHANAADAARKDFVALEKVVAMAADIGATLTIIAGIFMIVQTPIIMKSAWMHPKLALVAVLLGVHGFQRMRTGKYKRGDVSPNPAWVFPVIEVAVIGIIALAVAKPF